MRVQVIATVLLITCLYQNLADTEIVPDDGIEDRPLSKTCLRCLCEMMGCSKGKDSKNKTVGVFRLTVGYWQAAHYRKDQQANLTDWEECGRNNWCGVRTVQRFMRQHLPAIQAKRPDRSLCENAAALHVNGAPRGSKNITAVNKKKLFTCLHKRISKWLDIEP